MKRIAIVVSVLLCFAAQAAAQGKLHINFGEPPESVAKVEGVPQKFSVGYFGRIDEKTYYVILALTRDNPVPYYKGFRAFVGPAEKLREIKVKNVERYRDGGTTYVETTAGSFYFPRGLRGLEEKPTFRGEPIEEFER